MKAAIPKICRNDRPRRAALRAGPLNGLDYLEVDENDRHQLTIYFISKLGGLGRKLTAANFVIKGGRRVRDLKIVALKVCEQRDPELDDCVTLTVDRIGDFSPYTLCVVAAKHGRPLNRLHPEFDPVYACLKFTFQADCASPLDCAVPRVCPEPVRPQPEIDYLSKDYASFRQLLLDRLSLILPAWTERHEPDQLMTLVELLAYEGDRLSYLQDAVATEAYLNTARRRVSIRRHARLVDYFMHEGCNARAWVFVQTSEDTPAFALDDFFFVTTYPGAPLDGPPLTLEDLGRVPEQTYEVFEPLGEPVSTRLSRRALLAPAHLLRRLLQGKDPVDRFLHDRLSPSVLSALEHWSGHGAPPIDLVETVLSDLDRLAQTQTFHDEKAFAAHGRLGKFRRSLQKPLRGKDLIRLNRQLLESAFEKELAAAGQVRFYRSHNRIILYTWGELGCCLPRGATSATLLDTCLPVGGQDAPNSAAPSLVSDTVSQSSPAGSGGHHTQPARCLHLHPGDFLLFEEVLSPTTGLAADADPHHRQIVRLTQVEPNVDPVSNLPVLEVAWAPEDALTFPLCLSALGPPPDCDWIEEVSVARGNIVLVDHGRRDVDELEAVEVDAVQQPCEACHPEQLLVPSTYRPVLEHPELTFSAPLKPGSPATALKTQDLHKALPQVRLQQLPVEPPRLDLPDPLERYRNPLTLTAFDPEDLLSPATFVARLQKGEKDIDPVAKFLKSKLDQAAIQALALYVAPDESSAELTVGLLGALNAALDDTALYNDHRFPSEMLDEVTMDLMTARPLPLDLERLFNRWLLEQACPEVLTPTRRFIYDWTPRFDLLEAHGDERSFVVEMSDDRRAFLRFGDNDLGHRPEAATRFRTFYRVGNGTSGNVGAETIALFVSRRGRLDGLALQARNPLPAVGGTNPETLDEVRKRAPYAIRRDLARAVTADDYAALAARDFSTQLQGASAELIWTGSWYEARVTLDPLGRETTPEKLIEAVWADLAQYRRMGHDLRVAPALYVPLAITLHVCVKPDYQRAHVLAALRDVFSNHKLAAGQLGFFHPDALKFGQSVVASRMVATAQAVPGVLWSRVTQLERLGQGDRGDLANGFLPIDSTEIARVDSDPGFPENGSITFEMEGGR
jgi:predicted phage baseplate assembly protein